MKITPFRYRSGSPSPPICVLATPLQLQRHAAAEKLLWGHKKGRCPLLPCSLRLLSTPDSLFVSVQIAGKSSSAYSAGFEWRWLNLYAFSSRLLCPCNAAILRRLAGLRLVYLVHIKIIVLFIIAVKQRRLLHLSRSWKLPEGPTSN